jgi:glycogen debranching enzyme
VFRLEDNTRIEQEIFSVKGAPTVCLCWRALGRRQGVKLFVRPFLSGRDYHSLHKQNPAFQFDAVAHGDRVVWRPYDGVPAIVSLANGAYSHDPHWYLNFVYEEERERGLDFAEDLASPGVIEWDLSDDEAAWILSTSDSPFSTNKQDLPAAVRLLGARANERLRRSQFASPLARAADTYIVEGRQGKTILAGYPWFTDWGRDTFIALRGLCLATGRLGDAREILLAWAGAVSEGMLPNRFPDHGERPEFNSVDASLWYVIAVHEFLDATRRIERGVLTAPRASVSGASGGLKTARPTSAADAQLHTAADAILDGYSKGTRYGIRADTDGLLACGEPGVQLTWMDAKVGDWVVTPRIGKPVEVQALWLNALALAGRHSARWRELFGRGLGSFREKFWNHDKACLYDVIDVDHRSGAVDAVFRPNQILSVGGLPIPLFEGERARLIVEAVEDKLWTPLGLRSLAPGEPGYTAHYQGGVRERDGAYHQGTVWPWLIGPFVEAWVRVRGNTLAAKREARARFLQPLLAHLGEAGLGHISEIADAEPPHTPRGCPWQAWSVGEALRLDQVVLPETANAAVLRKPATKARATQRAHQSVATLV